MLGIIIGVGAVIAMVSIGLGVQQKVQSSIASLGSNLQSMGRLGEALREHERSAELSRAAGARPIDQAITQYNIGYLYRDYGDYPKSLAAHALPPEYAGRADAYIDAVVEWLPKLHAERLGLRFHA